MEIDKGQFRLQLLSILKHISDASFISIDLEMSGISVRNGTDERRDPGRPTLQQIYEETKKVAETFQILQVGITCVEEDRDKGMIDPHVGSTSCIQNWRLIISQNTTLHDRTTSTSVL